MSHTQPSLRLRSMAQLGMLAVAAMVASLFATSDVGASSIGQQIAQLQAQEASLSAQLASVQGQASTAGAEAASTQSQVAAAQVQLAAGQERLNRANAALAATNDSIAAAQAKIAVDQSQLALLITQLYQRGSGVSLGSAIADSSGIAQFVTSTVQLQLLGQQFSNLTEQLAQAESALRTLQTSQLVQQRRVAALVMGLQSKAAQLRQEEATFSSQASSLGGQASELAYQIQRIGGQIQALQAEEAAVTDYGGAPGSEEGTILATFPAPTSSVTSPNDYPWGQCTWYVATQTEVPWAPEGNADQWIQEDASMGSYSWGTSPRAGSMVVFDPGGAYDPDYGHVAWVVAVEGPSTFIVREANFIDEGSGTVDEREIYTLQGVEGFIYG